MANRFRLWFSRHGTRAIITIILIIAFCRLVDRADKYYANKNSESTNSAVENTNTENSVNEENSNNITNSNNTENSSNITNSTNTENVNSNAN